MNLIDLRSDTVTKPTAAMWEAMRAAELGDDVLGDEPTVQALERKIAALLGKEAALFVPSGTMANQLAIRCATEPGDEILVHRDGHVIHYETGAPAAISGCMIQTLEGAGGIFEAEAVRRAIHPGDVHFPPVRMVIVENTHNRGGGTPWSLAAFAAVAAEARRHNLHIHVDGARLFNACGALGYSGAEFATHADSVSLCFSKGLGCPVGSALCGTATLIRRARRFRKMLGGAMRQSGLLAGAAIYALDHNLARLKDDHANARRLAAHIAKIQGLTIECAPELTPTNMVFFRVAPALGDAKSFCAAAERAGVRLIGMGPDRVRAVTHLDVSSAAIDQAADVLSQVAAAR